jgi:tetratricopeptide (TPR) repeat protein
MVFSLAGPIGCQKGQSPATPQEHLTRGWDAYRMGEYTAAVHSFDTVLRHPQVTEDQRLHAMYGLGTVWQLRTPDSDPDKAREYFDTVVSTGGDSTWAAWSLLALAQMDRMVSASKTLDVEKVCAAYQRVVDRFPNHPAGEEAFLNRQFLLVTTFDPATIEASIVALNEFVQTHAESNYVSAAYSLLSNCYREQNRPAEQLAMLIRQLDTLRKDTSDPLADSSGLVWTIASIAEFKLGDFATARKYYQKLLDDYPLDSRRYGAKRAMERMSRIEETLKANPDAPISRD